MPPEYKRNDVDQCQDQIDLHVTITQHGSVIYTCSSQFFARDFGISVCRLETKYVFFFFAAWIKKMTAMLWNCLPPIASYHGKSTNPPLRQMSALTR